MVVEWSVVHGIDGDTSVRPLVSPILWSSVKYQGRRDETLSVGETLGPYREETSYRSI